MSVHPVITTLPAERLVGYAIAMEEVAPIGGAIVEAWALDRAALARGILARETAATSGHPQYWRLDDPNPGSYPAIAAAVGDQEYTALGVFSTEWRGLRWAVAITTDEGQEVRLFDDADEADRFAGMWVEEAVAKAARHAAPGLSTEAPAKPLTDAEAVGAGKSDEASEPAPTAQGPTEAKAAQIDTLVNGQSAKTNAPPPPADPFAPTPLVKGETYTPRTLPPGQLTALHRDFEAGIAVSRLREVFQLTSVQTLYSWASRYGWRFGINRPALETDVEDALEGPTAEEVDEARTMIIEKHKGALDLRDWFGWDLKLCQDLAEKFRKAQASA